METEKFETIKIWIRKVCGSNITEKNYLRRLKKFFEHYSVTPNELVEKWKGVRYNWTQREKFVDEWSEKIERYYALRDYAPLAKISEVAPVKSFFKHCRIPVHACMPVKIGDFYSPEQVFNQLRGVASKRGYNQLRITGNEPTIGKDHLFGILELVDKSNFRFILETKGILIGHDRNYAEQLSRFKNLHVRVSLKATSLEEFSRLTGAISKAFDLQLEALKNLLNAEVSFHPAIMMSFSSPAAIQQFRYELQTIDRSLADGLEEEYAILYPPVVERLKKADIKPINTVYQV